jgi:hypothetical protein
MDATGTKTSRIIMTASWNTSKSGIQNSKRKGKVKK